MTQKQQIQHYEVNNNTVFGFLIFENQDICKLKGGSMSSLFQMNQFIQSRGLYKIHKNDVFKFGRDPQHTSICMPNNLYVSNQHFKIWGVQFESDMRPTMYIKDMSLNGILVNGKSIGKGKITYLEDEDVLEIKHVMRMRFEKVKGEPTDDLAEDYDNTTANSLVSTNSSNSSSSSKFMDLSMDWEISNEVLGKGTFGKVYIGKRKLQLSKAYKQKVSKNVSLQKNIARNKSFGKLRPDGGSPLICAVKIIKVRNLEVQINESLVLSRLNHVS